MRSLYTNTWDVLRSFLFFSLLFACAPDDELTGQRDPDLTDDEDENERDS